MSEEDSIKQQIKTAESIEEILEIVDKVLDVKNERIQELEEENKSKQKAYDDCYCEYKHYKQFDSIPKQKVKDVLDKAEVMDYYTLPDVIEDLEKLLEDK